MLSILPGEGLRLFRVAFDEVDVGADVGDAVFPVVFVLDGNVSVEALGFEFFEAGGDIDDAFAGDDDGGVAGGGFVLEADA